MVRTDAKKVKTSNANKQLTKNQTLPICGQNWPTECLARRTMMTKLRREVSNQAKTKPRKPNTERKWLQPWWVHVLWQCLTDKIPIVCCHANHCTHFMKFKGLTWKLHIWLASQRQHWTNQRVSAKHSKSGASLCFDSKKEGNVMLILDGESLGQIMFHLFTVKDKPKLLETQNESWN